MREDDVRKGNRDIDYGKPLSEEAIQAGHHRVQVGGKWDEAQGKWDALGKLQREFLIAQGLQPHHRVIDVGCGSLRAGVKLVDYLDPGNYYGIDINESLLDVGYEKELTDELRAKLPRDHLRATERFDCDFGVEFDYGIAQSVFTHLSLNHVRLCMYRVAQVMPPGGRFYVNFFEAGRSHPLDQSLYGEGRRWTERNAFFYYRSDIRWASTFAPWEMRYIGEWGHPAGRRAQRMVELVRTVPEPEGQQNTKPGRQPLPRRVARRLARLAGR